MKPILLGLTISLCACSSIYEPIALNAPLTKGQCSIVSEDHPWTLVGKNVYSPFGNGPFKHEPDPGKHDIVSWCSDGDNILTSVLLNQ